MSAICGIYGASGFGKEVYPLVKAQLGDDFEIVFIDDGSDLNTLFGCEVLSYKEFLFKKYDEYFVVIAIADAKIREALTKKCLTDNIKMLNVEASNIVRLENVNIEDGYVLSPFVTLTSDIKIGKSFHANLYSYVAHDCTIGDYVTFAPCVKCNGNVVIENNVYIGAGAIIKQGKPNKPLLIGKGAVVQAGSFVTRNVPAGITVFGNPAVELTKENLKRRR